MIIHDIELIFVHIPKTGGRSIEKLLNGIGKSIEFQEGWDEENKTWYQHLTIKQIFNLRENCKDYFKFSFVRNPWDRMVSDYFYFMKHGISGEFKDFLTESKTYFNNFPKFNGNVGCKDHRLPQIHFLLDKNNDYSIDFTGKFENLQQDFDIICNKIGIPPQQLPHINKTEHQHYTEYYDEETKQIVAEKYAKEIELFGYKFGE